MPVMKLQASLLLAIELLTHPLCGQNWPEWRGPGSNGVVAGKQPPLDLAGKLLWKAELPGRGCSTPIVWENRIFVTSPIGEEDGLLAFDLSGKELWRKTFGALTPGRGQRVGSSANSSPVTDGEVVIAYFKSGTVVCTDLAGNPKWQINLQERYGKDKLWWDQGTSPVLTPGRVVIAVMQTEGESYLVSLDRQSGKVVWKTPRKYETGKESGDSYTPPHVVTVGDTQLIVSWGADHLTAHDAATGKLVWEAAGFNPGREDTQRVIASAVVDASIAIVPFKRGEAMAGVALDGKGQIPESQWIWRNNDAGSDAVTPVLHNGKVYVLKDGGPTRGRLACVDAKSGKQLWVSNLPKAAQVYYSSPVIAGDHFYCVREDGLVISGRLSDEGLTDLKTHPLEENVIASPISTNGQLIFRSDKHLFCFGEK